MPTDDPTPQPTRILPVVEPTCVPQFEIRVTGHIGPRWAAWFDGLELTNTDDGTTVISGPVVDQAALHGLLAKLRDLGIPLISVLERPSGDPADPPNPSHTQSPNPSGATS